MTSTKKPIGKKQRMATEALKAAGLAGLIGVGGAAVGAAGGGAAGLVLNNAIDGATGDDIGQGIADTAATTGVATGVGALVGNHWRPSAPDAALKGSLRGGLVGAGAGLLASAVQAFMTNTATREDEAIINAAAEQEGVTPAELLGGSIALAASTQAWDAADRVRLRS